jgi:hypothetical protein
MIKIFLTGIVVFSISMHAFGHGFAPLNAEGKGPLSASSATTSNKDDADSSMRNDKNVISELDISSDER